MANTNPVFNLNSPLVDEFRRVARPWNSFFQQFTQKAPAVVDVSLINPFTANAIGKLILTTATTITFSRGTVTIDLTGERIIPISIGDTVAWTGPAVAQFLGGV